MIYSNRAKSSINILKHYHEENNDILTTILKTLFFCSPKIISHIRKSKKFLKKETVINMADQGESMHSPNYRQILKFCYI